MDLVNVKILQFQFHVLNKVGMYSLSSKQKLFLEKLRYCEMHFFSFVAKYNKLITKYNNKFLNNAYLEEHRSIFLLENY